MYWPRLASGGHFSVGGLRWPPGSVEADRSIIGLGEGHAHNQVAVVVRRIIVDRVETHIGTRSEAFPLIVREYADMAATALMAGMAQSLRRLAGMYGRLAAAKEASDLDQCEHVHGNGATDGGECTTANISLLIPRRKRGNTEP
jgi:hypothetical protein